LSTLFIYTCKIIFIILVYYFEKATFNVSLAITSSSFVGITKILTLLPSLVRSRILPLLSSLFLSLSSSIPKNSNSSVSYLSPANPSWVIFSCKDTLVSSLYLKKAYAGMVMIVSGIVMVLTS
jgi:hypothetical protein